MSILTIGIAGKIISAPAESFLGERASPEISRHESFWAESEGRQRMLPCTVDTWDLVSSSLLRATDRFLTHPKKLLVIERESLTGDPVLVRMVVFGMLYAVWLSAPDLHARALPLLNAVVAPETNRRTVASRSFRQSMWQPACGYYAAAERLTAASWRRGER